MESARVRYFLFLFATLSVDFLQVLVDSITKAWF